MKAALLQFDPAYLEVAANLNAVEAHLGDLDADLLVLPELFATGYFFRSTDDLRRVAEPVPHGPTTQRLIGWAARTGATIVAGLPEADGDAIYNSAVLVGPNGYRGTYRKVHLYYQEALHFTPGDLGFPVFDVCDRSGALYRLGVMVCFDWRFPESARTLALRGADVIAHPSNLVRPNCPRTMPIRAMENHVYTITANRTGTETSGDETLTFIGQSRICSPDGEVLAEAEGTETSLVTASFDPATARARQITAHNHLFGDRRPSAYALE